MLELMTQITPEVSQGVVVAISACGLNFQYCSLIAATRDLTADCDVPRSKF